VGKAGERNRVRKQTEAYWIKTDRGGRGSQEGELTEEAAEAGGGQRNRRADGESLGSRLLTRKPQKTTVLGKKCGYCTNAWNWIGESISQ